MDSFYETLLSSPVSEDSFSQFKKQLSVNSCSAHPYTLAQYTLCCFVFNSFLSSSNEPLHIPHTVNSEIVFLLFKDAFKSIPLSSISTEPKWKTNRYLASGFQLAIEQLSFTRMQMSLVWPVVFNLLADWEVSFKLIACKCIESLQNKDLIVPGMIGVLYENLSNCMIFKAATIKPVFDIILSLFPDIQQPESRKYLLQTFNSLIYNLSLATEHDVKVELLKCIAILIECRFQIATVLFFSHLLPLLLDSLLHPSDEIFLAAANSLDKVMDFCWVRIKGAREDLFLHTFIVAADKPQRHEKLKAMCETLWKIGGGMKKQRDMLMAANPMLSSILQ